MTAPSPLIVETLAAHSWGDWRTYFGCRCGWLLDRLSAHSMRSQHRAHVAQALADAGILGPEQVREREAEAWNEGEQAGRDNADDGYPDPMVENPYRAGGTPPYVAELDTPQEDT